MIKHVVLFKFKDDVSDALIKDAEQALGALPAIVSEIRSYDFGRDVLRTERSYDFALVSAFDDLEALRRYQVHPRHQEVVQKLRAISSSILAVDYESAQTD